MTPGAENESIDDARTFADSVIAAAEGDPHVARRRWIVAAWLTLLVLVIACVWWLTPLREWVDLDRLTQLAHEFSESPFGPLVMIAMFVVGGLVIVPVNLLTAVSLLAFGAVAGSLYALVGAVISATVLYEIARLVPLQRLRRRFGARLQTIHAHLLRHGVVAVALVRLVPVAPYSIVCILLGALHVRRSHYLIGTTLGMAPGILVNAIFIDRVIAAIRSPSALTFALLLLALLVVVALGWSVRKRVERRTP